MNILSPPPTHEELEKQRERLDAQFVLGLLGLAACVMLACNGVFALFSSCDFGQPRWLSWMTLIGGAGGMPFTLFRALKIGHAVAGFEWVGADTGKVILEETRNAHVKVYCEAVHAQGRMLTRREAYMLLERFSDREAIANVVKSLPQRSMLEWMLSNYL